MKKAFKIIVILLLVLIAFPAIAGFAVKVLWNILLPAVCGFTTITFWQGVGLFVLGQILTGGFLLALFFVGGGVHALGHHHDEWKSRWHGMSNEQRREFINRRRRERFCYRDSQNKSNDATE